jgi:hypothetical protein
MENSGFVTDGDPDSEYVRKIDDGGYGSVHEVLTPAL